MTIRRTKVKRKLISRKLYLRLREDQARGVPMTVLVDRYNLDITPTSLTKLVKVFIPDDKHHILYKSFFPKWLDPNSLEIQTNPLGWIYVDRFPFGEWQLGVN